MQKGNLKSKILLVIFLIGIVVVVALSLSYENTKKENVSLKTEITQLKEDNKEYSDNLSDKQRALDFYIKKVEELQSELNDVQQAFDSSREFNSTLIDENELLSSANEDLKTTIQQLQETINDLQSRIDLLVSQLESMTSSDNIQTFDTTFLYNGLFVSTSGVPVQKSPYYFIKDTNGKALAPYERNYVLGYTYCADWTNYQLEQVYVGVYVNGGWTKTYSCALNQGFSYSIEITQDLESLVFYCALTEELAQSYTGE